MSVYLYVFSHFPESAEHNRNGYAEAQHVAARLTYNYSGETEKVWKNNNERNEEQSLSCSRKNVCTQGLARGLKHHVSDHSESVERIACQLPAQCRGANPYHIRVVTEYADSVVTEKYTCERKHKKEQCAHFHGKGKTFAQTRIKPRTIAESAERLESLPQTEDCRHDEHCDAAYDRHGRNGCIAVFTRRNIQHHHGNARKSLPR